MDHLQLTDMKHDKDHNKSFYLTLNPKTGRINPSAPKSKSEQLAIKLMSEGKKKKKMKKVLD